MQTKILTLKLEKKLDLVVLSSDKVDPEKVKASSLSLYVEEVQGNLNLFDKKEKDLFLGISEREVLKVPFSHGITYFEEEKEAPIFVHDYKEWVKRYRLRAKCKVLDVKLSAYLLNPGKKDYSLSTLLNEKLDLKAEKPEEKKDAPAMPGGGMGGMY